MPTPPQEIFLELSAVLTGFDRAELSGTGMVETYYDTLLRIIGEREAGQLFRDADQALADDRIATGHPNLERAVINAPRFAPVVVSLIKLWYLGSWYPLPGNYRDVNGSTADDVEHVVSAAGYREGLVWTAAGAHPMGGKPPGYGSWAEPPYLQPVF